LFSGLLGLLARLLLVARNDLLGLGHLEVSNVAPCRISDCMLKTQNEHYFVLFERISPKRDLQNFILYNCCLDVISTELGYQQNEHFFVRLVLALV
jgi:hypothetical protein